MQSVHLPVQSVAADAEPFCHAADVPAMLIEQLEHGLAFLDLDRVELRGIGVVGGVSEGADCRRATRGHPQPRGGRYARVLHDLDRQMRTVDLRTIAQGYRHL